MATRRGFTDHEHLDEVELIHMNGRVYDYNVGRFLSVDPIVHSGSQGINPYSYIMNNPLSGTDPSGYAPEQETIEVDANTQVYQDGDGNNYVSAGDGSGDLIKVDSISGKNSSGNDVSISFGDNGQITDYSSSNSSGTLSITDIGGENEKAVFSSTSGNHLKDPIDTQGPEFASNNNASESLTLADRFAEANDGFKQVLKDIERNFPFEYKMFERYMTNIDTTYWPDGDIGFELEVKAIRGFSVFLNHHVAQQLLTGGLTKEAKGVFPNKLKSELIGSAASKLGIPGPVTSLGSMLHGVTQIPGKAALYNEMVDISLNGGPQAFNEEFIREYY